MGAEPSGRALALGVVVLLALFGVIALVAMSNLPDRRPPEDQVMTDRPTRDCFTAKAKNEVTGAFDVKVDVDGDEKLDGFNVCRPGKEPWYSERSVYHVETASGRVINTRVTPLWSGIAAKAIGVTDLNGDRRSEVWIDLGGNTVWWLGLVVFDEGVPREVITAPDGRPADFLYGNSGNSGASKSPGIECTDVDRDGDVDLVTTHYTEVNPTFDRVEGWSYVAYHFDGRRIREVSRGKGKALASRPNTLKWGTGLNCAGLVYPDWDEGGPP